MITLITGTPGSGKTLYTVANLVQKLIGSTVTHANGTVYTRRVLIDGIKDLILDHEKLAPMRVSFDGDPLPDQEGEGVHNWWTWAKPGDVIVIDEVQRYWRPRGNGSKVPRMIAELETHRHLGVDFIIITQHPMLIDQNVRRLVARHLHIRRVFGGARAVVYEWDHCSAPDRVSDASKTFWPYPKDAFKFYKSAEVHTKQGGKLPFALPLMLLALLALPVIGYLAVGNVQAMLNPVAQPVQAAIQPLQELPKPADPTPDRGEGLPAPGPVVEVVQHQTHTYLGCISSSTRCDCYNASGVKVPTDLQACRHASMHLVRLPTGGDGGSAPMSTSRDEQTATPSPTMHRDSANAHTSRVAPAGVGRPGVPVAGEVQALPGVRPAL